jgi:HEAT repeat protein
VLRAGLGNYEQASRSPRCGALSMVAIVPQDVKRAINKLKSLHDGDLGVVEVIAFGSQAIPPLRELLFEREPSGLYQVRCRAVEALAALRAHDVLVEFLSAERTVTDPVERLGEDAVINAAALALAKSSSQRAFELLLRLGNRPSLTGVIGALGAFDRVDAIPILIDALEDDASRRTAEAALKRLGRLARPALLRAANSHLPAIGRESTSSVRRRRSALELLLEIGVPRNLWPGLRHLMEDQDAPVTLLACKICLVRGTALQRRDAIHRLISLLAHVDWMLRDEIEDCLITHFESARGIIAECMQNRLSPDLNAPLDAKIKQILLRVQERGDRMQPSPQGQRRG